MHFSNAFWHGNDAFPKCSSWNEIVLLLIIFLCPYSEYRDVKIYFHSFRYQNQNFSLVPHSCRSCSTHVVLVLHSCRLCLSCCTRGVCVAIVLLMSGTRVVKKTRPFQKDAKGSFFLAISKLRKIHVQVLGQMSSLIP